MDDSYQNTTFYPHEAMKELINPIKDMSDIRVIYR